MYFKSQLNKYHPLGVLLDPRYKLGWIPSSGLVESSVIDAFKLEVKLRYQQFLSIHV